PSNPMLTSRVRATIGGGGFAEMDLLVDFFTVAFRSRTGPLSPVRAGSAPIILTARITDVSDFGLSNVSTAWTMVRGGGAFSLPTTLTNTAGVATGQYSPGALAGHHVVQAALQVGSVTVPMRFAFRALPALQNRVLVAAGDRQTVAPGGSLDLPLRALVVDQFNNPVSGVTVSWDEVGGGNVGTTVTDTNGIASLGLTVGGPSGAREFRATAASVNTPATFTVFLLPAT
ncbi:MAG: Ig-like domain-containing protein, partial [Gemmatimonadales bacterium]